MWLRVKLWETWISCPDIQPSLLEEKNKIYLFFYVCVGFGGYFSNSVEVPWCGASWKTIKRYSCDSQVYFHFLKASSIPPCCLIFRHSATSNNVSENIKIMLSQHHQAWKNKTTSKFYLYLWNPYCVLSLEGFCTLITFPKHKLTASSNSACYPLCSPSTVSWHLVKQLPGYKKRRFVGQTLLGAHLHQLCIFTLFKRNILPF